MVSLMGEYLGRLFQGCRQRLAQADYAVAIWIVGGVLFR